jgi:hypothetical protein
MVGCKLLLWVDPARGPLRAAAPAWLRVVAVGAVARSVAIPCADRLELRSRARRTACFAGPVDYRCVTAGAGQGRPSRGLFVSALHLFFVAPPAWLAMVLFLTAIA